MEVQLKQWVVVVFLSRSLNCSINSLQPNYEGFELYKNDIIQIKMFKGPFKNKKIPKTSSIFFSNLCK